ncbi:hypothetical protein KUCAC02_032570 [Chaenocephalus aceratus]|nr:hypothetical protein KUCAC02_032570 [Chaenocephalus aceratus]
MRGHREETETMRGDRDNERTPRGHRDNERTPRGYRDDESVSMEMGKNGYHFLLDVTSRETCRNLFQ